MLTVVAVGARSGVRVHVLTPAAADRSTSQRQLFNEQAKYMADDLVGSSRVARAGESTDE